MSGEFDKCDLLQDAYDAGEFNDKFANLAAPMGTEKLLAEAIMELRGLYEEHHDCGISIDGIMPSKRTTN